jgi:hypothetical protein
MRVLKDPSSVLDYSVDWGRWLDAGETITAHNVTVPAGITLDSDTEADGKVTAWLSGGTAGQSYNVTYHITTSAGRTDERSIAVLVRDR